jgi:nicotinamidase-related amidase
MSEEVAPVDVEHAILLVMDFQNGIVERLADGDELLDRVAGAIATARARDVQVGYVRVAFEDADYDAVPPTNKLFARLAESGRAGHADSPATAVHDRVAPAPGDIVVRKTRVGAFSTTDLDEQLRKRGISTLLLTGISTSGVVLSTVRDAADHDYRIVVLADGCADFDAEVHEVLLGKVFPRQADVITVDELDGVLAST